MRNPSIAPLLAAASLSLCTSGCLALKGSDPADGTSVAPLPSQRLRSPTFGPTVTLPSAPPPLAGGTLLIAADGTTALAADPDRDRIVLVDLAGRSVKASVALSAHDEPGRATQDARGVAHVVLRGAGAVLDLDLSGTVLGRRATCPAPRGIAYDRASDNLLVACAGGELVTLPAVGGAPSASVLLDRDLRDVMIDADGTVLVTTLREAQVLVLAGSGANTIVANRFGLGAFAADGQIFAPAVAWRAAPIPGGGMVVSHQRAASSPVSPKAGGYGAGDTNCEGAGGIVHATATVFHAGSPSPGFGLAPRLSGVVLPVDIAVDPSGTRVAIVSAGNAHVDGAPQVITTSVDHLTNSDGCEFASEPAHVDGEAVAVAWDPRGNLFVQSREPARLQLLAPSGGFTIELGGASRFDTGWAIFHANSGAGLACASCHAEGGDDARTWSFEDVGERRTQSLRGGISGRSPFHWSGDQRDFPTLVGDVFVGRMSGPELAGDQIGALSSWVDAIPTVPATTHGDAASVSRGRALFNDATVGCSSCHAGAMLTDNAKVDVGTGGGPFKVPSLVNLATHAPFMHDGCAVTLRDRFGPCGGGESHGHTAQLSATQLTDLVAYLETL